MFGSTIEYMLRNYTDNFEGNSGHITRDGSLHSYKKEYHPTKLVDFENFTNKIQISTPIYPFQDAKLNEIINKWPGLLDESKNILIRAKTIEDAELNMLFQFYKISKGVLNQGLQTFCGDNIKNITHWNKDYKHWSEMKIWELREWLSIFYPVWVKEWIQIESDLDNLPNKLILNNFDILNNLKNSFVDICKFCNLTFKNDYENFVEEWTSKQQYIVYEFNLIEKILEYTLENTNFEWANDRLCLISECIIQKRLRDTGYEIKCYNLNEFPTNSEQLYNLLEKQ